MRTRILVLVSLMATVAWSQQQPAAGNARSDDQADMPGMDMSKGMSGGTNKDTDRDGEASMHAMHSMEGHMDMGPHMKMTALRSAQPGDAERAQRVVDAARKAVAKYLDYRVALADGFKIFHPELPQKIYHFTDYQYAIEEAFRFNPERPTSLLYEKRGDGYKLVGVMYTAPKRFNEDQLNERIPLSIAQWHEHVNFLCCACRPQAGSADGASAVWSQGIDQHPGSLRRCGRNIPSRSLWLDGARVPVRNGSEEHLVGRPQTGRRSLA